MNFLLCNSFWPTAEFALTAQINPFDLRGPEFLFFYAFLMLVVFVFAWLLQLSYESSGPGNEADWGTDIANDPYQIACLRGGRDEVIRIAVISLVERGLLSAEATHLKTTISDAADKSPTTVG